MNAQALNNRDSRALPAARLTSQFQTDLIALIPHLRAFSRTLCGERALADDIAQEALARAWRSRDSYEAGTNMKAWLFTILRNEFYSIMRRSWRHAAWDDEKGQNIAAPSNEQEWAAELSDTARAIRELPDGQREALILVGAGGFSYEDAAKIVDTAVGTMKSRVARGRVSLLRLVDSDEPLPRRSQVRVTSALDDILGQLSALTPKGVNSAAHA